jgi:hypothetical protein
MQITNPTINIITRPSIPLVQLIPAEFEAIIVLKGFMVETIVPIEEPI